MGSGSVRCALFLLVAAMAPHAAQATTISLVPATCPVGGERYERIQINSTSQFGIRLDLRPVGPIAYLPWDECPNGFILTRKAEDYSPDDIDKLTPLVESAQFQSLRTSDMPAMRVVAEERALGTSDAELAGYLMRAAWEAEDAQRQDLRLRYLAQATDAFAKYVAQSEKNSEPWWLAQIQRADVLRQLGRHEESLRVLGSLPTPGEDLAIFAVYASQIRAAAMAADSQPREFKPPSP
ncbi:MAG: hypothetical protein HXY22_02775 [Alphaproteobacteria bacterium]|nr:hypothetical protein [Alphaproteobacteria bacterium]